MTTSKYQKIKCIVDDIINKEENEASKLFDYFIVTLILANVAVIILESFEWISKGYSNYFGYFETFSAFVFTIEYILRIWTADLRFKGKNWFYSVLRFVVTPMAIIDLLAIAPFLLPMFFNSDLLFIRILRLITRILRVFKLNRYTKAMKLIGKVVRDKKDELLVTVFITFILLLVASALMFNIEHEVHGDAFPNIAAAFWWAVATLTTIGYGDVYPVTGLGKFLSAVIAMLGIGLVALPTGIISSSFMEELGKQSGNEEQEKREAEGFTYCPHCGKKLKE